MQLGNRNEGKGKRKRNERERGLMYREDSLTKRGVGEMETAGRKVGNR